ncbi:MAG: MarR family winged helix-turn-helix transcriptional regulator [Sphingobium sp.]|uniref:MarR family winged helix-turn-helix transcriptional regulator n=1 Tax=Sphingobium sp. TaxID=1912891 RepID=UPI003BB0E336
MIAADRMIRFRPVSRPNSFLIAAIRPISRWLTGALRANNTGESRHELCSAPVRSACWRFDTIQNGGKWAEAGHFSAKTYNIAQWDFVSFSREKGAFHAYSSKIPLGRDRLVFGDGSRGGLDVLEGSRITAMADRCIMICLAERVQRLRTDEFGKELFTMPAFEMLLELYAHRSRQPRSLTALTAASSASERNSQRIVHRMAQRELVALSRDPSDGRRILVKLTPQTIEMLDRFFDRIVTLVADLPMHKHSEP